MKKHGLQIRASWGLNYDGTNYILESEKYTDGYVRIEAKATSDMATSSLTPFHPNAPKGNLTAPQTFTGFAGSENSNYLVPELYINGLKDLEEGAIAKVFNAKGELEETYKLNKESIWEKLK